MTVMGAASLSASEFTRMRCPSGDTSYPLPCGWTKVVITDSGRRFTDEMDRNYPAGDRPARDWRHLLDHRLESVGDCFGCHGEHDWKKHDAPLIAGTAGAGYTEFPLAGLPGRVVPSYITPDPETGAGNWTDDQLARAIREGI